MHSLLKPFHWVRDVPVRWVRDIWHRFIMNTIWAPGLFPPESKDYRYRNIFRVVLPFTDIAFTGFGLVGYLLTVSSVEENAGRGVQSIWGFGVFLSALMCLVGISFPRLWASELIAKVILIAHVLAYVLFQFSRLFDPAVTAFAVLVTAFTYLLIWRVFDIFSRDFRKWAKARFVKHDLEVRDSE